MTCARVSIAVAARNGGEPVKQRVQDGSQGVDVGRRAGEVRPPLGLLRRHVAGRAEDRLGPGQVAVGVEDLGQAEVGDLGRSVGVEQDIGRLEVAVDDPLVVGLGDRAGQDLDQPGGLRGGPRRAVQLPVEAAARQVLQLEEGQAARLADMVDLDDAGVPEAGDRLGLGAEPRRGRRAGVRPGQDHLQAQGRFSAIFLAR